MGTKTQYSPTFPMYPGGAAVVTPSDTVNFNTPSIVYVGGAGNVQVTTAQGDQVTFSGLQAGQVIPVQVLRVWSASTTATNMIRIY
ncbi:hypothetical protein UFOVP274_13 [uncultured Caudovirales phage]|uniref:Uncharacterized protein n=1 Tax=uncultured Caudovirales phage TaxID=2100421 RepID=A0A6J5LJ50_9CAUD|nr:hypothetical protein UFOVP274_13 [uncultured Caudovirales phage]